VRLIELERRELCTIQCDGWCCRYMIRCDSRRTFVTVLMRSDSLPTACALLVPRLKHTASVINYLRQLSAVSCISLYVLTR
jgi:hypothetical protein